MNVGIGNDIRIRWHFIGHDGKDIDFSVCSKVDVTIRHSRYCEVVHIPVSINILNGVMAFEIPRERLMYPGIYNAEMHSSWPSDYYADGERIVRETYKGAFSLSQSGSTCADIELTSIVCIGEHSESQQVTILKAQWGSIIGDINNQEDLIKLLKNNNVSKPQWGDIGGDINNQSDLIDLIKSLIPNEDVFTITATSNNPELGTVTPKKASVRKGKSATFNAVALEGNYIGEWTYTQGVVFTGAGKNTGTAIAENVSEDLAVQCNFYPIPDFGISPTEVHFSTSGTKTTGEVKVSSIRAWSIQGGVETGSNNAVKLPWVDDTEDGIVIGCFNPMSGTQTITLVSAENKGEERVKVITFIEAETNATATLKLTQQEAIVYSVTGTVEPLEAGSLVIKKSTRPGGVEDGRFPAGWLGFYVVFVLNDGYSIKETDGIFDVHNGTETLLSNGTAYTSIDIINRNYTLKAKATAGSTKVKLTTGKAGAGSGEITSIEPSSSDGFYDKGTSVVLTANNGNGSNDFFDHWVVDGESKSSKVVTVVMNKNILATAHFRYEEPSEVQYSLTVVPSEGGTVSGSGSFEAQSTATAQATPSENYNFNGWTGDVTGMSNPVSVYMDRDKRITANFTKELYYINVSATPEAGGSAGVSQYAELGKRVSCYANLTSGWAVEYWEVDGVNTGSTETHYDLTVTKDSTVVAHLKQLAIKQYLIDAGVSENMGEVSGGGTFNEGETCTLTLTIFPEISGAGHKYILDHWRTPGGKADSVPPFVVNANGSYVAVLEPAANIQTGVVPFGSGTVTGKGTYKLNTSVTLTPTAAAGYTFDHWESTNGEHITYALFTFDVLHHATWLAHFRENRT